MGSLVNRVAIALLLASVACAACGPITQDGGAAPSASCNADMAHEVDPFKELMIVDDTVMTSALARNDTGGPLGFRHTMEQIAATPEEAPAATRAWLLTWAPASLRTDFDLTRAPFRLIGIANRMDLSEPSGTGAGEARLLFGATDGPGDDPASRPLPITVIVELHLVGDRAIWASRWHALGNEGAPGVIDANYMRALTAVMADVVHGENLAQLRVNDATVAVGAPGGVMLEYHRDATAKPEGRFAAARLRRTPSHALDGHAELRDFVNGHSDDVLSDRFELPDALMTERTARGATWQLPGVGEPLRHAFAASTCDGCHGSERPVVDSAFHVSPLQAGTAKLSRFLFDPEHRADDELTRRATLLHHLACGG
jgi:hypothetical protein